MTNEEKANEIAIDAVSRGFDGTTAYCCAMQMAEWKDKNPSKELVEKIFELTKEYLSYGGVVLDMNGKVVSPEDWILEQLKK